MRTPVTPLLVVAALASADAHAQSSRDEAVIKETLVAMWDAIERGDVERYASYLHPDFTSFGESDVYLAIGKEQELRSITNFVQRSHNVHTDMHQPQVTIRGDVAWIVYYWTDAGFVEGTRYTSRGKSTRIFVRENGKWLCIHGHYTAVP